MKSEQFEKIISELKANMEELRQYREIGTVEEVREAVNQVNIFKRLFLNIFQIFAKIIKNFFFPVFLWVIPLSIAKGLELKRRGEINL